MTDLKKILVPVDFSSCSREVLGRAIHLSERYFGAPIDVLHVWEPREDAPAIDPKTQAQCVKAMDDLLAATQSRGAVPIRRLHETGDPVKTILEAAKAGQYDMIIMGTHGRTGLAHDYLGSVAEKVVRRAPCPVLVLRETRGAGAKPAGTAWAAAL